MTRRCEACGPGRPRVKGLGLALTLLVLGATLIDVDLVGAAKNEDRTMSYLCKSSYSREMYKKIDGFVVTSQNERNLDCSITFQTHSIVQRFLLKFDRLQLDCNDHLYIYDAAHSVGNFKADLSCRDTMQSVGAIYTHTNFVTLKYITDAWGTDANGFRLIITAVKDPKHACRDFKCTLKEFCIAKDLVCDGVSHCEDGSDEEASTFCVNSESSTILGMESTWFAMMMVCLALTTAGLVAAGALCFCKQRVTSPRHPYNAHNAHGHPPVSYPLQPVYGSNGTSMSMPLGMTNLKMGPYSSGAIQGATTLPRPGNWLHPAGLKLGHSAALARLYCQAK